MVFRLSLMEAIRTNSLLMFKGLMENLDLIWRIRQHLVLAV